MIAQYIKATCENIKNGSIVIRTNTKGHVYGSLMICIVDKKEIKKTGEVFCYRHNNKGCCKIKKIPISILSKIISKGLK